MNMQSLLKKENSEKRIEQRKHYSGPIFFATHNRLYEGELKNFSHYGLFIRTKAFLAEGEMITIALPYLDNKAGKCKGQIMWRSKDGFGVELLRKRSVMNLRIVP